MLLIDSHDGPIADAVWKLFEIVISRCGPVPTLVEWDSKITDWPILKAEAAAAQAILDRCRSLGRGLRLCRRTAPQFLLMPAFAARVDRSGPPHA